MIPENQLIAVETAAKSGDLTAIKRLIAHYDATSGNEQIAANWRAKARSLGDARELYNYAAELSVQANNEVNSTKRNLILIKALDSAVRSNKYEPDATTQDLINEINLSLARNSGDKLR